MRLCVSTERPMDMFRNKLLSGISALALATAFALPAMADESVTNLEVFGPAGDNSYQDFQDKHKLYPSTAGQNGGDINLINSYATTGDITGVAILLGSTGGRGGWGINLGDPATRDTKGQAGGKGGDITLVQNGALTGHGALGSAIRPANWSNKVTRYWGLEDKYVDDRWDHRGGAVLAVYSQGGHGGFTTNQSETAPGGAGGAVAVTLNNNIRATGDSYSGVWLRSLGGYAAAGARDSDMDPSVFKPGDGGAVSVTVSKTGSVSTSGQSGPAILAESLGGKGFDQVDGFTLSNAWGTNGGAGGKVSFRNAGSVQSDQGASPGVILQSAGGDAGGNAYSRWGSRTQGQGGKGGDIIATNGAQISTAGKYSFGLFALSVGANGGKGSSGIFSGGDGGAGGPGGTLGVSNYGTIVTNGEGAAAMVIQSLAGGNSLGAFQVTALVPGAGGSDSGGAGGSGWLYGGAGGAGGTGGTVQVVQNGTIRTDGQGAYGLVAQSIGGGGGHGGEVDSASPFFSIALGGRGGSGGDGGTVQVLTGSDAAQGNQILRDERTWALGLDPGQARPSPSISTTGQGAAGIVAMSVGGSGGVGGSATAKSTGVVMPITFAVGGAGGGGGHGGTVEVTSDSLITTSGRQASGISASSIGGGGGVAGSALAYANAVSPPGTPNFSISFAVGGTGGKGGRGGDARVTNEGVIITTGSSSDGIDVMSVGGGGGQGGVANSTSDIVGFYLSVPIAIAVGGNGGDGGRGGIVHAVNDTGKEIETFGNFSHGISAISVGGGGGKGGTGNVKAKQGISWNDYADQAAGSLPQAESLAVQLVMGGKGGKGGGSGDVDVINRGNILTHGSDAQGIHAQSIGGGGGDGGGYLASGSGTLSATAQLGGAGGGGGEGGPVTVTNAAGAIIDSRGDGSIGIFAQSVGGGGGNAGGFAGTIKSAVNFGDSPRTFILQVIDELFKYNDVMTYVKQTAASIDDNATSKDKNALTKEDKENVKSFFDNFGKDSDTQKRIKELKSIFKIIKLGFKSLDQIKGGHVLDAAALFAVGTVLENLKEEIKKIYKEQNFAKPDHNLPKVDLSLAMGGTGGSGGNGGVVNVTNNGAVTNRGDASIGILAQSVGGGGGRGGAALATGNNTVNVNISLGGTGGSGGKGGIVDITNTGDVTTFGGGSFALFAQSVGGGGGIGGAAASANSISMHVEAKVGGSGGTSSDGGVVTVTNSGRLVTYGKEAHALVAQSVGGGGGVVLVSRIDPDSSNVLATSQDMANTLSEAQEMLTEIAAATLGSSTATQDEKKGAQRIVDLLAQEIVGPNGGGTSDASSTILPTPSIGGTFGGNGGAGGNGGNVTVTHEGVIATQGLGAIGIFAQSIGGGGGIGVDAGSDGLMAGTMKFGGSGGSAGNGGTVKVALENGAHVSTLGTGAHGLFLQSIGGGGGYGGTGGLVDSFFEIRGETGGKGVNGNGGTITVDLAEGTSITTAGKQAHGVFAQSLGAGGGAANIIGGSTPQPSSKAPSRNVNLMKGNGGDITVTSRGTISAIGEGSYGLFLQSGVQKTDGTLDPWVAGGRISVEQYGAITGGSKSGAAIRIDGGSLSDSSPNIITIAPGAQVSAASGAAIYATFGRDSLINQGTITGDINLAYGGSGEANSFENQAGGIYVSKASRDGAVYLGKGGVFTNAGTLSIGGDGYIGWLKIAPEATFDPNRKVTANLGGTVRFDLDSKASQKSDTVTVRGDANIGNMTIKPHVLMYLHPGDSFKIMEGKISGTPTVSKTWANPIFWTTDTGQYGSDLYLRTGTADFVGRLDSPTTTEMQLARSLQADWNAKNANQARLFASIANVETSDDYMDALDALSSEEQGQPAVFQTLNAPKSLSAAMNCPIFVDSGTMIDESQCAWARITGVNTTIDSFGLSEGLTQNNVSYRLGAQWEIAEDWFLGATAAYTSTWGDNADGMTRFNGDGGDVSIALRHQMGQWLLASALHLGYGVNDITSTFNMGDQYWTSVNPSTVWTGAFRARATYEFAFSGWYLRPFVDLDVIYTYVGGYTISADLFNLKISDMNEWTVAIHPAVEIGARLDLNADTWLRPYFTAGVTYLSNKGLDTQVDLFGDVEDGNTFTSTTYMPNFLVDLGAGLQLFAMNKYELRGEYKAQIGDHFLSQEGSLRLATSF